LALPKGCAILLYSYTVVKWFTNCEISFLTPKN
jgi:hypothetical protein